MKFTMSNKPLNIFSFSSLTDIVMLLLIFFLLTSQFVIYTGVKIKLPGAKNNEQSVASKLIVTITANDRIYVGNEEISLEALAGKLSSVNKEILEQNLIIRSDKDVKIERVINIIDAAKGIGINKFTIETEKESF
jgi:biopolymer transport protein ExbD